MDLIQLGWNTEFEKHFLIYREQGYIPGRVALEHKKSYRIYTEQGILLAEIAGKLRYQAKDREDFPAVGDWVVLSVRHEEGRATIHAILPRKSKFSRKAAGNTTEEQIVATNIDTLFLVNALNQDLNVRRIERYLLLAWESGAQPVLILSKADVCDDVDKKRNEVEAVAIGVPIHVISSMENQGIEALSNYITDGKTIALLGSSGVGKSTISNILYGQEIQRVQEIREGDDRGKHTTTHREMIMLPSGGILIDTPGMRELQLWESEGSLEHSFSDIEEFAKNCQYRDCQHQTEPGCSVKRAIYDGLLDQKRYLNYEKLQRELAFLDRKSDKRAQLEEKKKWKKISGDRTRVHRI